VQNVGGDLNVLAAQTRQAIEWYTAMRRIWWRSESYLAGRHSSGAHLAGVALTTLQQTSSRRVL